jgi:hypothetical protein
MNKDKKILYVKWGGLGDHLQFTTLPEEFSKYNCEFYLSDKSEYRSKEIYDLVWKTNPYVKGISSENPNCGHLENWGKPIHQQVAFEKNISMHRNIEKIYGIDSNSNYPKIYYKPKNLIEYNEYILIDLNAYSIANYQHNLNIIKEYLSLLKNNNILYILPQSSYGKSIINPEDFNYLNFKYIKTNDIFNYTDLIYSCKKFVCLWSGGSHVAVAIKKHYKNNLEIDCFKVDTGLKDWGSIDKSFFWYDNINYIPC